MKHVTPRRAIGIAAISLLVAFACSNSDTPVSFTPDTPDIGTVTTTPSPAPTATPTAQPEPEQPGRCEIINIRRRDVSVSVDGLKVTMNVPVSYDGPGQVYVYVWLPEVNNGIEKGPFHPNTDFSFTVAEYKTYQFQLAVEVDLDGDKRADQNLQCDNHRGSFTTRQPPCVDCDPPTCEELFDVDVSYEGSTAYINLRNTNNQVVASRQVPLTTQAQFGEICANDGQQQPNLRGITTEDRGCCLPYELPPVCEQNPSDRRCAPECEFGDPVYEQGNWKCPTCEEVTEPNIVSILGEGTVNETLHCKNVGLCGSNGQNCNIVAGKCRGKFSNTNYGNAKVAYSRVNPFTCSLNATGPGTFKMILRAANPGNFPKRQDSITLGCREKGTINLSFPWKGHNSEDWNCEGYINGSFNQETPVVDGH